MNATVRNISAFLVIILLIACSGTKKNSSTCEVGIELEKLHGIQQLADTSVRDSFIALDDPWKNDISEWQRATKRIIEKTGLQTCEALQEQAKILMGLLEGLEEPSQKIRRQIVYSRLPKEEEKLQMRAKEASQ